MKPEVDQIMGLSATQLMTGLGPLLPTQYAQGGAMLTGIMLMLSAQEYDRAAEIRVAENQEIRALFAALAPMAADPALKAQLESAAATDDTSLKISALDERNYALRRLLIALHEHVEAAGAREANARIWAQLKTIAARRELHLPSS